MKNGVYDIKHNKLLAHKKKYLSSVQLPINYDPEATCPVFKKALKEIMPDKKSRRVLQEVAASCIDINAKTNKAIILYGTGSNGKSVYTSVISMLCGSDNVSSITLKDLEKPFSKAQLYGKTVNISPENETNGKPLESQHIKAIVTGDLITVENKFEKPFQFRPCCRLLFCTNNLPEFNDRSKGLKRRILIIRFAQEFKGRNEDRQIINKFEKELPGIFNYALRGLKRLRENNFEFTHSTDIENMTEEFMDLNDPIALFIKDTIEPSRIKITLNTEIREKYKHWCIINSRPLSDKNLIEAKTFWIELLNKLHEQGISDAERTKSNGVRGIKFIKFKILNHFEQSTGILSDDDEPNENEE